MTFKRNANKTTSKTTNATKKGAKEMETATATATKKGAKEMETATATKKGAKEMETAKEGSSLNEIIGSLKSGMFAKKAATVKENESEIESDTDRKDTEWKFLCQNPTTKRHYRFEEMFGSNRGKLTMDYTTVLSQTVKDFFSGIASDFTSHLPEKGKAFVESDMDFDECPLIALAVSCDITNSFDTKAFVLTTLMLLCKFGGMLVTGKGVGNYGKDFEKGCLYLMNKYGATVKDPKKVDWCGKLFRTPLQNRLGKSDFALCSLCNSAMCFDIRFKSRSKLIEQLDELLEYSLSKDDPKTTTKRTSVSDTQATLDDSVFGIISDEPKKDPKKAMKDSKPTAFTRPKSSKKGDK